MPLQYTLAAMLVGVNLLILGITLRTYAQYRHRRIPYLNKCLLLALTTMVQGVAGFLCTLLPEGGWLTGLLSLNMVLGTVVNILHMQTLLGIMGFGGGWALRFQRLLYVLPCAAITMAATNPWHRQFIRQAVKSADGYAYHLEGGTLAIVLSAFSSVLIMAVFIVSFVAARKGSVKFLNMRVNGILLAATAFPSLVRMLEEALAGPGAGSYNLYLYFYWVPISVICNVYFGYLRSARSMAVRYTQEIYLVFDKWGSLVDQNDRTTALFQQCGLGEHPTRQQFARQLGLGEISGLAEFEFELQQGGRVQYFRATSFNISDTISQHCGDGFLIREVTEYREQMNQLAVMAEQDGLTGIKNRRSFDQYAPEAIRTAAEEGEPLTLLMMDLDRFKEVNDNYGHLVGDEVLIKVCDICQRNLRKRDMLFRYGGEELAVISIGTTLSEGEWMAARLLNAIRKEPLVTSGGEVTVTISIGGCTLVPGVGDTIDRWLETADQHLYMAKENGRNQVVYK